MLLHVLISQHFIDKYYTFYIDRYNTLEVLHIKPISHSIKYDADDDISTGEMSNKMRREAKIYFSPTKYFLFFL